MIFSAIIKGIAIGLLLAISVGPVIFAIIRQSLNNGHKGGILFVTGVSSSDILLVLLCNFFTQLFPTGGLLEKLVGYGGSVFLMILGLINFFSKAKIVTTQETGEEHKKLTLQELLSIYFSGFLMNTLNPAVFIFWMATSASIMVDAKNYIYHYVNNYNEILYRFIVFIVCLAFTLSTDIAKVFLAGKIRKRLTAHNIHIINRISGVIFVVFGCILLYSIYTGHNPLKH